MTWGDNDYNGFLKQDFIFFAYVRVLAERVSLFYLLLTKDFRISNACKIPEKRHRRAEEAARGSKDRFEETGVTEFQSKNVVWEMSVIAVPRPPSWQREAETSIDREFIGHEYDAITVQLEKKRGISYKDRRTAA